MDDLVKRLRKDWHVSGVDCEAAADTIERLRADVLAGLRREEAFAEQAERLTAERDVAIDALRRAGFVECDIPACNCGSWHARYGFPERWRELADQLEEAGHPLCNENGNLMLNALRELVAERDALQAKLTSNQHANEQQA